MSEGKRESREAGNDVIVLHRLLNNRAIGNVC